MVKAGECLRDCVASLAGQGNLELVDLALEDSSCQGLPLRIQEAAAGDSAAAFQATSAAFMLGMVSGLALSGTAPSSPSHGVDWLQNCIKPKGMRPCWNQTDVT